MAALRGFDSFVGAAVLAPPYTAGATLLTVALPAKTTVGGADLSVSDLDGNTSPTIGLDVGDAILPPRFLLDDKTARDGGAVEYRPLPTLYYRYNLAADVLVTVNTGAATGVAGTIGLTVYGYPSLDLSDVQRMTLQVLGVLAEGETPRAGDATLAAEAITEIHEQLRFKKLANRQDMAWPVALIPAFAGRPYARMAANLLADTFGVSMQRAAVLAQRAEEAEREMRRQTQVKSIGGPVSLEPYREPPPFYLEEGVLA